MKPKVNATNLIQQLGLEAELSHKIENVYRKKVDFFLTPAQKGDGQPQKCKEPTR